MTNNYSSQNDESPAKNTNLKKPVSSYLSEMEYRRDQEETDAVHEELLNIINPQKKLKPKSAFQSILRSYWLNIAPTRLQKIFLGAALFWYILFLVILANPQVNILWAVSIIVTLYLWFIFFAAYQIVYIKSTWQSPRDSTKKRLNQLKNEYIDERKKIICLRRITSQTKLKYIEIDIERLLKESQNKTNFNSSFSPILAIIMVAGITFILGVRVEMLENNWLKAIIGAVPLITVVLNFTLALISKSEIDGLNKCLAILKKAQISTDEIESYENLVQSEDLGKKQSFMSKIKNISIDAPADFSVNHDKY